MVTLESLKELSAWCVEKKRTADKHDASQYRHLQQSLDKVIEIEVEAEARAEKAKMLDEQELAEKAQEEEADAVAAD